jgi:hypothetical protein
VSSRSSTTSSAEPQLIQHRKKRVGRIGPHIGRYHYSPGMGRVSQTDVKHAGQGLNTLDDGRRRLSVNTSCSTSADRLPFT